jgi:hypothetical protein
VNSSSSSTPSVPLICRPCRIRAISRAKIAPAAANRSGPAGSVINSRITPTAADTASAHRSRWAVAVVVSAAVHMAALRVKLGTFVPFIMNYEHGFSYVKLGR